MDDWIRYRWWAEKYGVRAAQPFAIRRVSRFLVNDTLRRDGAVPEPFILPISSTITRSAKSRAAYDSALDRFSKPFMARYPTESTFGAVMKCEDGVVSNFRFSAYEDARFAWAFPDLTAQTEYLGQVIQETVATEMRQEAGLLLDLRQTRERVKNVLEAPDVEIDRIIRSIRQNFGTISRKLAAEFPILGTRKSGPRWLAPCWERERICRGHSCRPLVFGRGPV